MQDPQQQHCYGRSSSSVKRSEQQQVQSSRCGHSMGGCRLHGISQGALSSRARLGQGQPLREPVQQHLAGTAPGAAWVNGRCVIEGAAIRGAALWAAAARQSVAIIDLGGNSSS